MAIMLSVPMWEDVNNQKGTGQNKDYDRACDAPDYLKDGAKVRHEARRDCSACPEEHRSRSGVQVWRLCY
jgi:hypothetical protein